MNSFLQLNNTTLQIMYYAESWFNVVLSKRGEQTGDTEKAERFNAIFFSFLVSVFTKKRLIMTKTLFQLLLRILE